MYQRFCQLNSAVILIAKFISKIPRKTFFTFYYFFPKNLLTVKLALCHRANVNKTETVFKERMPMFDG